MKTINEMYIEVRDLNDRMGWNAQQRTFREDCALLHEETSEAFQAWRRWGFDDHTGPDRMDSDTDEVRPAEPEGVGPELADVFIRLLDTLHRHPIMRNNLLAGDRVLTLLDLNPGRDERIDFKTGTVSFGDHITDYHENITDFQRGTRTIGTLFIGLLRLAQIAGVDMLTEYERKMAYNRTRSFRHGGKRL